MKKLDILKAAAEILVSAGIGTIVGNAIKQTTKPDANSYTRVSMAVGGFVLSSMVSDLAHKYVNEVIDDVAGKVAEILRPEEVVKDELSEELSSEQYTENEKTFQIDKDESDGKLLPKKGTNVKQDNKEGAKE